MDYCRLCAELKDPDEIITSIDDVEQSMEQKLRACCQWTAEIIEHRLPHSVCAICLDKLENCWLFSQSVQLAQQRLLEIFENETETKTKPLAAEIVQIIHNSAEPSNTFPSTSTAQSERFNRQMLPAQRKQNPKHKCEICSQEFHTATELSTHRQQGCEGLIEMDSIAMDCKPTAVDFYMDIIEIPVVDNDNAMNVIDEQTTTLNSIANQRKRKKPGDGNKMTQNKKRSDKMEQLDGQIPKKRFACGKCDRVYSEKAGLVYHMNRGRHVNIGHPSKTCPLCNKTLTTNDIFNRHLLLHAVRSKGELKIDDSNNQLRIIKANGDSIYFRGNAKPIKCEACERIFTTMYNLKNHIIMQHSSERLFECWLCHKSFKTLQFLKSHLKIHIPNGFERNSICELCGKAYKSQFILSNHMQTAHSNERPYKCETCGFSFKIESHLKTHLLSHNGYQFKCNQCEKKFRSNHSLKQHLETHTGMIAKPFVCDFCGLGLRRSQDLKDHRRIHTGEMPYSCEHCASNFRARSSYYTHMRKFHGISLLAKKKEKMTK